jgi:subtilisin family serine protease
VDAGEAVRPLIAGRADVDRVLLSPRLRPLPAAPPTNHGGAPPPAAPQWNIERVHADQVWRTLGITGRGIVVGTSDSGVDGTHPALRNGFRGDDDSWFDPWNNTRTPTDHGGHGTHTIGSAVGRAPDGAIPGLESADVPTRTPAAVGVAPGAQWVGCVNLDRNLGNPAYYLDCMQFMLAPFPYGGNPWRDGRPGRAPHVLTNSWGCPGAEGCDTGVLRPATAALAAAGIFFVAAAGNEGPRCGSVNDPPAPYADVLSVGAVDRQGRVTDFSSRGPAPDGTTKPDVAAPGADVLSALPGDTYGTLDGTSMATPHVAGVVALMWSANPRLVGDVVTTRRILLDTAKPPLPSFGEGGDDACGSPANVYGAGVVDALAAVQAARAVH